MFNVYGPLKTRMKGLVNKGLAIKSLNHGPILVELLVLTEKYFITF